MLLPELRGRPIEIRFVRGLRDRRGPAHGGAFVRERRIHLDAALRRRRGELARIFVHEIFHFAWVRLGNARRRAWEALLAAEFASGAAGELGWSAEGRKQALRARDRAGRTRRWREYCCESFCDTAACLFAGVAQHPEFTLASRYRARRRAWFERCGAARAISI